MHHSLDRKSFPVGKGGNELLSILSYGALAGLATTMGAVVVLLFGLPDRRGISFFLGLAAGVMLAVVVFDLLPSAFQLGTCWNVLWGLVTGGSLLWLTDHLLSLKIGISNNGTQTFRRLGYLIALGIAMHDLPEGIAIALGYATAERLGPVIAMAIGLHNIPEGMATAAPLFVGGIKPSRIILLTLVVSLITPLGTALGILLTQLIPQNISLMLAFAAGCMLYLVIVELLPESRRHHPKIAYLGFFLGISLIIGVSILDKCFRG
jgi:ZIP family zinc transporter